MPRIQIQCDFPVRVSHPDGRRDGFPITLCARAAVSGGSRARACWLSLGQYAWGGPRSVGGAVSSPGFRRPVRGLVRATLLRDDFGQTNACCASLVIPTRGPERLEG